MRLKFVNSRSHRCLLQCLPRAVAVWQARTPLLLVLPGKFAQPSFPRGPHSSRNGSPACPSCACVREGHADRPFSGIGLETSILFAKEGANVLLTDISQEALDRAVAKVKQLVPNAGRVESKVTCPAHRQTHLKTTMLTIPATARSLMLPRRLTSKLPLSTSMLGAALMSSSTTPASCTRVTPTPLTPPRTSGT